MTCAVVVIRIGIAGIAAQNLVHISHTDSATITGKLRLSTELCLIFAVANAPIRMRPYAGAASGDISLRLPMSTREARLVFRRVPQLPLIPQVLVVSRPYRYLLGLRPWPSK